MSPISVTGALITIGVDRDSQWSGPPNFILHRPAKMLRPSLGQTHHTHGVHHYATERGLVFGSYKLDLGCSSTKVGLNNKEICNTTEH